MFIQACKKPYDDPPVKTGISNLVVDCTITNDPPPYSVRLTKSTGYNQQGSQTIIRNAKMSIIDDVGNIENVIEKPNGSGIYQTSPTGMQGQIGKSYKIKIGLTSNGKITSTYESEWVRLNESPVIDSIYAQTGQVQVLLQQSDGSYYTITVLGLNMYIDATPPAKQDYYYKFESSMLQEYTQVFYPNSRYAPMFGPPPVLYGWFSNAITLNKDLKAGVADYSIPIKSYFLGFIPEFFSQSSDSFHDAPLSAGAVITAKVYSVSKEIYQIFTEENSQTKPVNSIFDPIPTQLETNIKCTSDTTQSVLGYFNAASVIKNYHFFLWAEGFDKIYSYKIDSLPTTITPAGIDTNAAPGFWFYPNPVHKK